MVTAISDTGLYIQTPSDRSDSNDFTSDGIFVFTNSRPDIAIGSMVNVTGKVSEYFGFTEITDITLLTEVGTTIPINPFVLSNEEILRRGWEALEGMLVSTELATITGPSNKFGEALARVGSLRSFREPGTDTLSFEGLPNFDQNKELFMIDTDGLESDSLDLWAGSTVSNLIGVMSYSFGDFKLLPIAMMINPINLPQPIDLIDGIDWSVGSFNILRFGFGEESEILIQQKKLGLFIAQQMKGPDVLMLEEVKNKASLDRLIAELANTHGLNYLGEIIEGSGSIHTAMIWKTGLNVDSIRALGSVETFNYNDTSYRLHDRAPLAAVVHRGSVNWQIIGVHMRSLNGIEAENADFVRAKRFEQSISLASMIQSLQTQGPVMVMGDFKCV